MKPVRIALIGAGGIVSLAHKPAFQQFFVEVSARIGSAPQTSALVRQLREFAKNVRGNAAGENSVTRNLNTIAVVEALGRNLLSGIPKTVTTG